MSHNVFAISDIYDAVFETATVCCKDDLCNGVDVPMAEATQLYCNSIEKET